MPLLHKGVDGGRAQRYCRNLSSLWAYPGTWVVEHPVRRRGPGLEGTAARPKEDLAAPLCTFSPGGFTRLQILGASGWRRVLLRLGESMPLGGVRSRAVSCCVVVVCDCDAARPSPSIPVSRVLLKVVSGEVVHMTGLVMKLRVLPATS